MALSRPRESNSVTGSNSGSWSCAILPLVREVKQTGSQMGGILSVVQIHPCGNQRQTLRFREAVDFGGFVDVTGDGSNLGIAYDEFIGLLLEKIRRLETRIDELEANA